MKKYENFCRAFNNLDKSIVMEPPYDTVTLTGLVGLFEITFEQARKMIKEVLEFHGYESGSTGSPRLIIKTAYQAGIINDEEMWLMALTARNNVSHSYNEKIALSIVKETKDVYTEMFRRLKKSVEKDWMVD